MYAQIPGVCIALAPCTHEEWQCMCIIYCTDSMQTFFYIFIHAHNHIFIHTYIPGECINSYVLHFSVMTEYVFYASVIFLHVYVQIRTRTYSHIHIRTYYWRVYCSCVLHLSVMA